jgi:hypothetical protein
VWYDGAVGVIRSIHLIKLTWLAVPLFVLGTLVAACGGGDDETIDLGDGDEVTVSEDLPDDFPDDFPVYDGADVLGSISGEQAGEEGTVVTWETDDSAEDVTAFYEQEFEDGPWTTTSEGSFGGLGNFTVENGDQAAYVLISETDGNTTIVVTYGAKGDLGFEDGDSSDGDDGSSDGDDGSSDGDDGSSDGEDGSSDGDDGSGEDDGSSGSAELPDEVEVDDDYPEDEIPLPDAARVTSSSSFASGGNRSIFVELYVETTVDEAADYYATTLEGAGYSEGFRTETDGEVFMSYTKGDDPAIVTGEGVLVNVAPSEVDGYVLVSLTITSAEEQ